MKVLLLILLTFTLSYADIQLAPDGSFVDGDPQIAPNGKFVGTHHDYDPYDSYPGSYDYYYSSDNDDPQKPFDYSKPPKHDPYR